MSDVSFRRGFSALLFAASVVCAPSQAQAQVPTREVSPRQMSLTLYGSYFIPRGGGDLLPFFEEHLSIAGDDLHGRAFGIEGGVGVLSPRLELVGGFESGRGSESPSRMRNGTGGVSAAEQFTRLSIGPTLILGGKLHLRDPASPTVRSNAFIIGGGGRVMRYSLDQWGSFHDAESGEIFSATFHTEGSANLLFAGIGGDLRIVRGTYFTGRMRYQWSSASPHEDFEGFEEVDLSGVRVSIGVTFRR